MLWRWQYYDATGRNTGYRSATWNPNNQGLLDIWFHPTSCGYDPDGQVSHPCPNDAFWTTTDGPNTSAMNIGWRFVSAPGVDELLLGRFALNASYRQTLYFVMDGAGRQLAVGDSSGFLHDADFVDIQGAWQYAGATQNGSTFNATRMGNSDQPGVSYFRNRAYDSRTGRWLQEDPIGIAGGLNLYQFNGNNPVAYTDPFGLCPWCPAAIIVLAEAAKGAVVGAVAGAIEQAGLNKLNGRPLLEGVGHVALVGAAVGAVTGGVGSATRIGRALGLARSASGLTDINTASRAEGEAVGELHVGNNRVNMLERGTTEVKGVRNPTTGAKYRPEPGEGHVNLQNDQGGNVHVKFPEP